MELLFPGFLWALAALAIPIIIHLFYFKRYKKVYFSNVKHLKEIKEETSNRSKLRNLLVLLARLFALACLVLAFVQPILGKRESSTKHQSVGIFVDNSFSMDARMDDVPLLDIAKQHARDIIMAYSEGDQFQVLTHDLEGRHQRYYNREQALDLLDEIHISPNTNKLSKIINRHQQLAENTDDDASIYILSDFQEHMLQEKLDVDTTVALHFVPVQGAQMTNVSIDTAYLASIVPSINTPTEIVVKLTNHSDQDAEGIRLSSTYEGLQRPEGQHDIKAASSIYDTISVVLRSAGMHNLVLEVNDFPVVYDNTYFLSIKVPDALQIRSLYEQKPNPYLARFQNLVEGYTLTQESIRNVNYNSLQAQNLIILDEVSSVASGLAEQLRTYVVNGGNLLIFPSGESDISNLNSLLTRLGTDTYKEKKTQPAEVKGINTSEYIFNDVYERLQKDASLPKATLHYSMSSKQRMRKDVLMTYRDGSPYISKYSIGEGRTYVSSAPLSSKHNNLIKIGEVFVPMVIKMSLARNSPQQIAHTIGKNLPIVVDLPVDINTQIIKLYKEKEIIPGQQIAGNTAVIDVRQSIKEAGMYEARIDNKTIHALSFNYSRDESDVLLPKQSRIESLADQYGAILIKNNLQTNFASMVKERNTGRSFWPYLIIGALLFLLIETLLLKFWKPY